MARLRKHEIEIEVSENIAGEYDVICWVWDRWHRRHVLLTMVWGVSKDAAQRFADSVVIRRKK